jgi:excisionase family DNA binding protein
VINLLPLPLMSQAEPEQLQLEAISAEPSPPKRDSRHADGGGLDKQRGSGASVAASRILSQPDALAALLTTQEAAALLRVHPRTIQRLVERGQLSAVHLGAAVRFDPADVADLTTRLKSRAAAPATSTEVVKPSRATRASFAERIRSQQHEHRAAQA